MLTPEFPQRQEAEPPGKTSELSQRQEAEPPGKTSELSQGRTRQNHQERHQSYAKTKVLDIKSSMSNTQTSNHQNHHQRSCCHIAAGSTSKEG